MLFINFIFEIIGWFIIWFVLASGIIFTGILASSVITAILNFLFNKE